MLRAFRQQGRKHAAFFRAQVVQDVGKLIRVHIQAGKRVALAAIGGAYPVKSDLVAKAVVTLLLRADMAFIVLSVDNHRVPYNNRLWKSSCAVLIFSVLLERWSVSRGVSGRALFLKFKSVQ